MPYIYNDKTHQFEDAQKIIGDKVVVVESEKISRPGNVIPAKGIVNSQTRSD